MKTFTVKTLRSQIGVGGAALLAASGLLGIGLAPSAGAATIYTYTGNAYTLCGGTYCVGGPYALSLTFETLLTGAVLENLPLTDITPTVSSYEFTDASGLILSSGNNPSGTIDIRIATNASGNVVAWLAGAYTTPANTQMQTNWNTPVSFSPGADLSETTADFLGDFGFVPNNPGTWAMTTAPEPSTVVLPGIGLVLFGLLRTRRAPAKQP